MSASLFAAREYRKIKKKNVVQLNNCGGKGLESRSTTTWLGCVYYRCERWGSRHVHCTASSSSQRKLISRWFFLDNNRKIDGWIPQAFYTSWYHIGAAGAGGGEDEEDEEWWPYNKGRRGCSRREGEGGHGDYMEMWIEREKRDSCKSSLNPSYSLDLMEQKWEE